MPNDLEDFLKRAAALRQQKAAEQRAIANEEAARASRTAPPAYTDRNRERQAQVPQPVFAEPWDDDEPVLMGELVEPEPRILEQRAFTPKSVVVSSAPPPQAAVPAPVAVPGASAAKSATSPSELHQIMLMLMKPGGARQAFLLKEIFDRKRF